MAADRLLVVDSSATRATLLARLRDDGDPAAWAEFFQRYHELIGAFARRWGLQPADCEDVVQETLARLVRALPTFEYDRRKGRFRGYLKSVVSSVVVTKLRQRRAAPRVQTLESAPEPSGDALDLTWESEWRQHHLRHAMRRIRKEFSSPDCEAFNRYAIAGEGAQRTADALGMSLNRVHQAKSRILKRVRELIDEQIEEEES